MIYTIQYAVKYNLKAKNLIYIKCYFSPSEKLPTSLLLNGIYNNQNYITWISISKMMPLL